MITDTATHDAGTQHSGLFDDFGRLFAGLFGFGFDQLVVQEQTNLRGGCCSFRQLGKTGIFQRNSASAVEAGGFLNGFHCHHRCRVMFAGLGKYHTFGGAEAHDGFSFIQFQRLEFGLTFFAPVQFAGDSVLYHRQGCSC